jgi:serine phosphatase RsbU (regulator of sigma subunit)
MPCGPDHPSIIATMCLVQLDVPAGEMEIVNCGHIPPLLPAGLG